MKIIYDAWEESVCFRILSRPGINIVISDVSSLFQHSPLCTFLFSLVYFSLVTALPLLLIQ